MRRWELVADGSAKFWEIEQDGATVTGPGAAVHLGGGGTITTGLKLKLPSIGPLLAEDMPLRVTPA